MLQGQRFLCRITSLVLFCLAVSFGLATVSPTHPPSPVLAAENRAALQVPAEHGRLVGSFDAGPGSTWVVLLQDVHAHPEAQRNAAAIINSLADQHGFQLVCSEGAAGPVDTSAVSSFPAPEILTQAADLFLESGELSGEEYASITAHPSLKIRGIEDPELYFEQGRLYLRTLASQENGFRVIQEAAEGLEVKAREIWPGQAWELDQSLADFQAGTRSLPDFIRYLSGLEKESGLFSEIAYPQMRMFGELAALKEEFGDLDTVVAELKGPEANPSSEHLEKLLKTVLRQQTLSQAIHPGKLGDELGEFSEALLQSLLQTGQQKELYRNLCYTRLLGKLVNLSLSRHEFEDYLELSHDFRPASIPQLSVLDPAFFQRAEDFYRVAAQRDSALLENILAQLKQESQDRCVVVTGGYHTDAIAQGLREQGVSYTVLQPSIRTEWNRDRYHQILFGHREDVARLFQSPKDAYRAYLMFVPLSFRAEYSAEVFLKAAQDTADAHEGISMESLVEEPQPTLERWRAVLAVLVVQEGIEKNLDKEVIAQRVRAFCGEEIEVLYYRGLQFPGFTRLARFQESRFLILANGEHLVDIGANGEVRNRSGRLRPQRRASQVSFAPDTPGTLNMRRRHIAEAAGMHAWTLSEFQILRESMQGIQMAEMPSGKNISHKATEEFRIRAGAELRQWLQRIEHQGAVPNYVRRIEPSPGPKWEEDSPYHTRADWPAIDLRPEPGEDLPYTRIEFRKVEAALEDPGSILPASKDVFSFLEGDTLVVCVHDVEMLKYRLGELGSALFLEPWYFRESGDPGAMAAIYAGWLSGISLDSGQIGINDREDLDFLKVSSRTLRWLCNLPLGDLRDLENYFAVPGSEETWLHEELQRRLGPEEYENQGRVYVDAICAAAKMLAEIRLQLARNLHARGFEFEEGMNLCLHIRPDQRNATVESMEYVSQRLPWSEWAKRMKPPKRWVSVPYIVPPDQEFRLPWLRELLNARTDFAMTIAGYREAQPFTWTTSAEWPELRGTGMIYWGWDSETGARQLMRTFSLGPALERAYLRSQSARGETHPQIKVQRVEYPFSSRGLPEQRLYAEDASMPAIWWGRSPTTLPKLRRYLTEKGSQDIGAVEAGGAWVDWREVSGLRLKNGDEINTSTVDSPINWDKVVALIVGEEELPLLEISEVQPGEMFWWGENLPAGVQRPRGLEGVSRTELERFLTQEGFFDDQGEPRVSAFSTRKLERGRLQRLEEGIPLTARGVWTETADQTRSLLVVAAKDVKAVVLLDGETREIGAGLDWSQVRSLKVENMEVPWSLIDRVHPRGTFEGKQMSIVGLGAAGMAAAQTAALAGAETFVLSDIDPARMEETSGQIRDIAVAMEKNVSIRTLSGETQISVPDSGAHSTRWVRIVLVPAGDARIRRHLANSHVIANFSNVGMPFWEDVADLGTGAVRREPRPEWLQEALEHNRIPGRLIYNNMIQPPVPADLRVAAVAAESAGVPIGIANGGRVWAEAQALNMARLLELDPLQDSEDYDRVLEEVLAYTRGTLNLLDAEEVLVLERVRALTEEYKRGLSVDGQVYPSFGAVIEAKISPEYRDLARRAAQRRGWPPDLNLLELFGDLQAEGEESAILGTFPPLQAFDKDRIDWRPRSSPLNFLAAVHPGGTPMPQVQIWTDYPLRGGQKRAWGHYPMELLATLPNGIQIWSRTLVLHHFEGPGEELPRRVQPNVYGVTARIARPRSPEQRAANVLSESDPFKWASEEEGRNLWFGVWEEAALAQEGAEADLSSDLVGAPDPAAMRWVGGPPVMVAVDWGGTQIRGILGGPNGLDESSFWRIPTEKESPIEDLVGRVAEAIAGLYTGPEEDSFDWWREVGEVRIGFPGKITEHNVVHESWGFPQVVGLPLARMLEAEIQKRVGWFVRVKLYPDTETAAYGEAVQGLGAPRQNTAGEELGLRDFFTVTGGHGHGTGLFNRGLGVRKVAFEDHYRPDVEPFDTPDIQEAIRDALGKLPDSSFNLEDLVASPALRARVRVPAQRVMADENWTLSDLPQGLILDNSPAGPSGVLAHTKQRLAAEQSELRRQLAEIEEKEAAVRRRLENVEEIKRNVSPDDFPEAMQMQEAGLSGSLEKLNRRVSGIKNRLEFLRELCETGDDFYITRSQVKGLLEELEPEDVGKAAMEAFLPLIPEQAIRAVTERRLLQTTGSANAQGESWESLVELQRIDSNPDTLGNFLDKHRSPTDISIALDQLVSSDEAYRTAIEQALGEQGGNMAAISAVNAMGVYLARSFEKMAEEVQHQTLDFVLGGGVYLGMGPVLRQAILSNLRPVSEDRMPRVHLSDADLRDMRGLLGAWAVDRFPSRPMTPSRRLSSADSAETLKTLFDVDWANEDVLVIHTESSRRRLQETVGEELTDQLLRDVSRAQGSRRVLQVGGIDDQTLQELMGRVAELVAGEGGIGRIPGRIVVFGGGSAIDLGKVLAWRLGAKYTAIPTSLSTNAHDTYKPAVTKRMSEVLSEIRPESAVQPGENGELKFKFPVSEAMLGRHGETYVEIHAAPEGQEHPVWTRVRREGPMSIQIVSQNTSAKEIEQLRTVRDRVLKVGENLEWNETLELPPGHRAASVRARLVEQKWTKYSFPAGAPDEVVFLEDLLSKSVRQNTAGLADAASAATAYLDRDKAKEHPQAFNVYEEVLSQIPRDRREEAAQVFEDIGERQLRIVRGLFDASMRTPPTLGKGASPGSLVSQVKAYLTEVSEAVVEAGDFHHDWAGLIDAMGEHQLAFSLETQFPEARILHGEYISLCMVMVFRLYEEFFPDTDFMGQKVDSADFARKLQSLDLPVTPGAISPFITRDSLINMLMEAVPRKGRWSIVNHLSEMRDAGEFTYLDAAHIVDSLFGPEGSLFGPDSYLPTPSQEMAGRIREQIGPEIAEDDSLFREFCEVLISACGNTWFEKPLRQRHIQLEERVLQLNRNLELTHYHQDLTWEMLSALLLETLQNRTAWRNAAQQSKTSLESLVTADGLRQIAQHLLWTRSPDAALPPLLADPGHLAVSPPDLAEAVQASELLAVAL
ncbi:MAG: hypothetical protein JW937_09000 [Candidatus Omnitrophica bacterium]|nr:hypothetical protein [Candidatus Omnitrophota bacterium]